ncbi:MAG: hypothetical protein HYY40_12485, partial [Bacteroidetes bacterium]|nr:hypothetical protein [Bacteroidota bacterium]
MSDHAKKLIEQAIKEKATFLDLGNCGLTAIPYEISNLPPEINHINFGPAYFFKNDKEEKSKNQHGRNNFAENILSLDLLLNLTNLKKLELYDCYIGEKGAESISALSGLTSLNIWYNEIGDKGAESISALTGLTSLDISDNEIGDKGAESISALTGLTSLDISDNEIGEKGAESISALTGLTSLDISDNEIGDKGAES